MEDFFDQLALGDMIEKVSQTLGEYLPVLLAALCVLIGGWFIALILSAMIRKILGINNFANKVVAVAGLEGDHSERCFAKIISKTIYYILMVFVLVAFFQTLGLTIITEPLNALLNQIFEFVPNMLGALVLLGVAWLIATGLKLIISKSLAATKLDDRLSDQAGLEGDSQVPVSESLANVAYWFVFLLFLPAILGALGMEGLLEPVQAMLDNLLGFLPSLLGAGIILFVGWFMARIVRQISNGVLTSIGTNKLGEKVGLTAKKGYSLSGVISTIIYALVLIPAIIASLNALQVEAISKPATEMLGTIMQAVPSVFGALIVLGVTYLIAKLVSGLVTNVLAGIGFNKILSFIGLGTEIQEGKLSPAEIVGHLIMIALMLFATIEAVELLGFETLGDLITQFVTFGAQVLLGIVIFGIGLYFANLTAKIIKNTAGPQANMMAKAAYIAIIVLAAAMGLEQMGIASDIINLAFGLILGAIAVAVAISFGIGGKDIAAREVEKWFSTVQSKK